MFEEFSKSISAYFHALGFSQSIGLLTPPSPDLGDFSIIVNQLVGKADPVEFANAHAVDLSKIIHIDTVEIFEISRNGKSIVYLNFKIIAEYKIVIRSKFIKSSLSAILSDSYPDPNINKGKIAIVEHTSANPISPLHIGNLRNSVHGDTIARILETTGYTVSRHFYVNDVGLQVAFVVLGYEKLKVKGYRPSIKPDLWFGRIYAIMHNLYYSYSLQLKHRDEFHSLGYEFNENESQNYTAKRIMEISTIDGQMAKLEDIVKPSKDEKLEIKNLNKQKKQLQSEIGELEKLIQTKKLLNSRFGELMTVLLSEFKDLDLVKMTSDYLVSYEKGKDIEIKTKFRELADWVLATFFTTLKRFNIEFDVVDYESDVSWSGLVNDVLKKLSTSEFVKNTGGETIRFQYPTQAMKKMLEELNIDNKRVPIKGNIPELQLMRKDGSALYAAKDIAYSIAKYNSAKPDLIVNVISTEQTLPQYQLLLPLFDLGYIKLAGSMIHYAYELVELRGRIMSGRMAMYVTADEYIDETIIRSRMAKRISEAQKNIDPPSNFEDFEAETKILNEVAIAATRFPLIETSPYKKIVIDLDRELDFRRNSGPFVQYAHARTCSLFSKLKDKIPNCSKINFDAICDDLVIEIVKHLADFNSVLIKSIDELDPSLVASWVYNLALKFQKFYEIYPIMSENDKNLKNAKIVLLKAIQKGLMRGLQVLGIPASEKL